MAPCEHGVYDWETCKECKEKYGKTRNEKLWPAEFNRSEGGTSQTAGGEEGQAPDDTRGSETRQVAYGKLRTETLRAPEGVVYSRSTRMSVKMEEVFIVVDDTGHHHSVRELSDQDLHEARIVIRVLYEVSTGLTLSKVIKNSLGYKG
jgi:hypothetical protein